MRLIHIQKEEQEIKTGDFVGCPLFVLSNTLSRAKCYVHQDGSREIPFWRLREGAQSKPMLNHFVSPSSQLGSEKTKANTTKEGEE